MNKWEYILYFMIVVVAIMELYIWVWFFYC